MVGLATIGHHNEAIGRWGSGHYIIPQLMELLIMHGEDYMGKIKKKNGSQSSGFRWWWRSPKQLRVDKVGVRPWESCDSDVC